MPRQVKRDREALLGNEHAARLEAETSNRAKDMFLATLSHEMRTPLNAIVGWMSILRPKDYEDEDMVEGLEVIERNTKAQVQLIEDVLDVSRIVIGKLRLEIRPCELMEIINAGIDVVRPGAAARGIIARCAARPVGQSRLVRSIAHSAGRLESGFQRREIHPQGRAHPRHAGAREIQLEDSGQSTMDRESARNCCPMFSIDSARRTVARGENSAVWDSGFRLSSIWWKRTAAQSKRKALEEDAGRRSP